MALHVVLYQPEIPANTGTVGRSCVLTGASLHLVGQLGFSLDDRMIRRSGMGYWRDIELAVYRDWGDFTARHPEADPWMFTKRGRVRYDEIAYGSDDWLMFGSESVGIAADVLAARPERTARIPMLEREGVSPTTTPGPLSDPADPDAVSLNLSNAANIVLYEALRQQGFPGM